MRPRLAIAATSLALALVSVQAFAATPGDPYERINRRAYALSTANDERFILPLAKLYHALTPGFIGEAIHNFVTNLSEPAVVMNDILQVRLGHAGRDLMRLAMNSTFGLAGFTDIAGHNGFPHRDNDFGITLGVWGVGPGPYLYVPFLGPSTVRDAFGQGVNGLMQPLNYARFPGRLTLDISSQAVGGLDKRLRSQGDLDAILSDADDPYATLRSVYLQSREATIRGEDAVPASLPTEDISPAPPGPSAAAAPMPATAPAAAVDAAACAPDGDADAPIMTARAIDRDGSPTSLGRGA